MAQIGRWRRGISLPPSDWISPNLMALWTKVSKGEGILLFIRLRLKRQRCFLLFSWLEDFEIIRALSIEKRLPDVSKIVPCTIDCYDTFWPVAFALAFYREGLSKKIQFEMCFVVYGVSSGHSDRWILKISSYLGWPVLRKTDILSSASDMTRARWENTCGPWLSVLAVQLVKSKFPGLLPGLRTQRPGWY